MFCEWVGCTSKIITWNNNICTFNKATVLSRRRGMLESLILCCSLISHCLCRLFSLLCGEICPRMKQMHIRNESAAITQTSGPQSYPIIPVPESEMRCWWKVRNESLGHTWLMKSCAMLRPHKICITAGRKWDTQCLVILSLSYESQLIITCVQMKPNSKFSCCCLHIFLPLSSNIGPMLSVNQTNITAAIKSQSNDCSC